MALVTSDYDGCVVTNGFYVIRAKNDKDTNYLFGIFKKKEIQDQIKDYSSGTIMASIDDEYFDEIKYSEESKNEYEEINNKINKVFELIGCAKDLINSLK